MHSAARTALTVLFKRKWLIAGFLLLVGGAATAYIIKSPTLYQASTSLLVKFGREYVYRQEVGNDITMSANYSQDEIINSLVEIIRAWGLADRVVREIGPGTLYPQLVKNPPSGMTLQAAAVLRFIKDLKVSPTRRSNVIVIDYSSEDPKIAADALNLLVEAFQAKHVSLYGETRFTFLEAQLGRLKDDLRNAETKLELFQQENRVYALEGQRDQLLKQQSDITATLNLVENDFTAFQRKRETLKAQVGSVPANVALSSVTERSKIISEAESQLLSLRLREQQLSAKLGDRHPSILQVREEIKLAESNLRSLNAITSASQTTGANQVHQTIQAALLATESDLQQADARRSGLKVQLSDINRQIDAISANERVLRDLVRQRNEAEEIYQGYSRKVEEARVSEDMDRNKISSIAVIEPAAPPPRPEAPGKLLKLLLSIAFAVTGSVGLAFVVELASRRFSSADQVERTFGIPVLATFPLYKN